VSLVSFVNGAGDGAGVTHPWLARMQHHAAWRNQILSDAFLAVMEKVS
jgi:hypothetical protein